MKMKILAALAGSLSIAFAAGCATSKSAEMASEPAPTSETSTAVAPATDGAATGTTTETPAAEASDAVK